MPTILRALGADSSVYVHSNSDDYGEVTSEETLSEPEPESASEPEPEPAPVAEKPAAVAAPVAVTTTTDTISATRYLTTMARKHYGQMEYWVYIYMENADKLGHPDRLEAGTVVVIPPASKYGLIPGDKAKLSEASSLAIDIYSRFK
jgi:nucleoid-associated protein YgaU